MLISVIKLFLVSLIPVGVSISVKALDLYTGFKNFNKVAKAIIIGLIFGGLSVLGTVLGVTSTKGAVINIRDVAPIVAGLIFGGPSGIIAGFIGGIYRFVCVYWGGAGAYTQIACSISTICSGIFAALVRRFIFDRHHGTWYYGLGLGLFVEDFHMLMVFFTHMDDTVQAYEVVKACALPMVLVTSLAVMFSIIGTALLCKEKLFNFKRPFKVSTYIQLALIGSLVFGYAVVSIFTYTSVKNVSEANTTSLLKTSNNDILDDINDSINRTIESQLYPFESYLEPKLDSDVQAAINDALTIYNISEINLIDKNNLIQYSTNAEFDPANRESPFDMASGEQSNEFTCLLLGEQIYIQAYCETSAHKETSMKYAGIVLQDNSKNLAYAQIGYDTEAYHDLLDAEVQYSAENKHVNSKGFVVVCNELGKIVSQSKNSPFKNDYPVKEIIKDKRTTTSVAVDEKDTKFYYYATYMEGFYLISFANFDECNLDSQISFMGISLSEILIFLFLYIVNYYIVKRIVVKKVENIDKSLDKICEGDLSIVVNERSTKEFDVLSTGINTTVSTLKGYIAKEAEKIAKELEFAKEIQTSTLPSVYPTSKEFKMFAFMDTAKEVGGDFYDFYFVDPKHFVIQIADVSGKGVPAAMFMMQSKTIIKSLVESGMSIEEAYTKANAKLCEGNDAQMFVTAWLGKINIETGHVEYVNAGHNAPALFRKGEGYSYLKSKRGLILSAMDGYSYKKQELDLQPGDKILLYTDGVTEATNKNNELYGEDRLLKACNDNANKSPKEFIDSIIKDMDKFVDENEQADDITMLAFSYKCEDNDKTMTLKAELSNVGPMIEFVDTYLDEHSCSIKAKSQIDIALDEVLSNIARYAYKDEVGDMNISVHEENGSIVIKMSDSGIPYNPLEKEDPDITSKERDIGGLGIFITKKIMDEVTYSYEDNHNILVIKKKM